MNLRAMERPAMTTWPTCVVICPATDADMAMVAAIYAHHVRHDRTLFETAQSDTPRMGSSAPRHRSDG
jgi:L-amino acid N-acyltransferase YncA